MSSVTIPTEIVPQGGGAYLVKPGKPLLGRAKLTIAEAAARANLSPDTILRLYDAGLVTGERPTPRKTFIFIDSLDAHLQASHDQEYWDQNDRRTRFKKARQPRRCSSKRKRPLSRSIQS